MINGQDRKKVSGPAHFAVGYTKGNQYNAPGNIWFPGVR